MDPLPPPPPFPFPTHISNLNLLQRFQSIAPLLADKVESYKLNLETDPAEAKEKLKLESVPALLVYKGGEEVERVYKPGEAEMKEVVGRLLG